MYDVQGRKFYNCKILTAKRNKPDVEKHEKHIGSGWYEYTKKQKFRCGDVLSFRIRKYVDFLYVQLSRK